MKKLLILSLLCAFTYDTVCKATPHQPTMLLKAKNDSLSVYTGRYESKQKVGTFLVEIMLSEDGRLIATSLWDGNKYPLKPVSADNFIMQGFDWSVKFIKNKDNKISRMLVKGTEYWEKVK